MFTTLALLALSGAAQALTIATPASLVQCQPIKLSWSDGTAPYYLSVIPGGQASAAALVSWPKMEDTSYTWTVDLPAQTSVTIQIVDGTGTTAFSSPVTIQAGSDTSCMNSSSEAASSTDAAAETSAAASEEPAASSETSEAAAPSSEAEVASSAPAAASTPATSAAASSAPASSGSASSASRATSASSAASAASSAATSAPADSAAGRTVVGSAALAVAGLVALAAF